MIRYKINWIKVIIGVMVIVFCFDDIFGKMAYGNKSDLWAIG